VRTTKADSSLVGKFRLFNSSTLNGKFIESSDTENKIETLLLNIN